RNTLGVLRNDQGIGLTCPAERLVRCCATVVFSSGTWNSSIFVEDYQTQPLLSGGRKIIAVVKAPHPPSSGENTVCMVEFEKMEWESSLPGARFKAYCRDGKRLRLVEFTSAFAEPHWCEKGHLGIVLHGELEVE